MQYKGKLFGVSGGEYIPLVATADDFDTLTQQVEDYRADHRIKEANIEQLKRENAALREVIKEAVTYFEMEDVSVPPFYKNLVEAINHE